MITQKNTSQHNTEYENSISGSSILGLAFRMFQEGDDVEGGKGNFSTGVFHGVMNHTVRLVATNGLNIRTQSDGKLIGVDSDRNQNDLVVSIFKSENEKEEEYKKMGMTADSKEADSNTAGVENELVPLHFSCRQKLLRYTTETWDDGR